MMLNNEKLRNDAVSRLERDEKAKREAIAFVVALEVRFVIAVLVGSLVFATLTVWWVGR